MFVDKIISTMEQLKAQFKDYFNIDEEKLNPLLDLFEIKILNKGDLFLHSQTYCKELAFIKEGIIRVSADYDGKDITQWISTKGYYVCDLDSFFFNTKSRWNIIALTTTRLYSITRSNYDRINEIIPDWNIKEKQFIVHCFTTLENRVFQFLSMSAEERYQYYFNQNKELFNQIPIKYIASILGMTPETLSRIRQKS